MSLIFVPFVPVVELDEGKSRDLFLSRNVFYVDNIAVIGIKFRDYEGERTFIEK